MHLLRDKRLVVTYRPLGVVGIITPWNFPFILALNPTAQALIAGNAVVLKPSEVTPFSGRLVGRAVRRGGAARGRVQSGAGRRRDRRGAGRGRRRQDLVHGQRRDRAASRRGLRPPLIPCTLELGGKDPMIVCDDADLERAAAGAVYGAS